MKQIIIKLLRSGENLIFFSFGGGANSTKHGIIILGGFRQLSLNEIRQEHIGIVKYA